jgi:hypothetical protein
MENRGFEALGAPPKRGKSKIYTRSIYKQNKSCCQVGSVLDCRRCDPSQSCMRSTVCSAFNLKLECTFNRGLCVPTYYIRS